MTVNGDLKSKTEKLFRDSIDLKNEVFRHHLDSLVQIAEAIARSIQKGGKLLLCGNGGSAADAQHLAAELLVRLRPHVNRTPIPAVALHMDASTLTGCGNDFGFEVLYERMVEALGQKGDVVLGITTSGRSKNITRALRAARRLHMTTIGFLGSGGGEALGECDLAFVVPSNSTGRVQEVHITAGHAVMEMVEDLLLESGVAKCL
jgi:D-sedoheptulose 7-phosphate isomerase